MSTLIDPSIEKEFKSLQEEGKRLAAEGKLKESLKKFELAKQICPSSKVLKRIEKLKEYLKAIEKESLRDSDNLSSSHVQNDLCSKSSSAFFPELKDNNQKVLPVTKVLSDIQNVQKSSISRITSKSTDLSPTSQSKFRQLKKLAKESAYAGKYDEALEYFRKALSICDCPHVKRYIQEVQLVASSNPEEALKSEDVLASRKEQESSSSSAYKVASENKSLESCFNYTQNSEILIQKVEKSVLPEVPTKFSQEPSMSPKSIQSLPDENDISKKLEQVKVLYEEARDLAADGKLTNALKVLKKAQSIHETQKVDKRIQKLEELISSDINDSDSNRMIKITEDFSVFQDIYDKLYPYQREGVAWMWKLYKMHKGGVLGDDMGLGKTFQVIAFISGMIDADLVKHVLILMPVSLLQNWSKEFKKWCPGIIVHDYHGGSKKDRERNLLRVQKRGHVLLTSYGMVVNNVESLTRMDDREFVWDYLILDEGHKIKNPTKTTKAVYEIPSKNRLVLTGTPIQNNLRELWSLYDFVQQGTLLGTLRTFKLQYENPITRSREKDATAGERQLGTEIAQNLKDLIKPYFLRRTKDEIWDKKKSDDDVEQLGSEMEKMTISKLNAKKNDLILWTYMSEPQIEIYNSFLHSEAVKSILVSKRSPLVELTTLKKICDHPRLLSQRACLQLGLNGELQNEDLIRELDDESTMASSIDNVSDETLLLESGKLKLVLQLLENLKETGHRTLIFSLSRKILDMIHRILVNRKWKVMRLDGTVTKTEERERRIQRFQNDPSYPVFLLTTQVGGVGITLTAADRVIIYDPSWNPATDAQAVDRAYRIGQKKDVIVYRLITCGSVEEKIYRRQIFKDSITRQATGVSDPYRYFSSQELRELFSLDDPHYSATQVQLSEMHSSQRLKDNFLERHIHYLQSLNIFGISDHDLMFTKNIQDHSEDNDKAAISEEFIKKQVATAHELIKMEASVVAEGIRLARTFNRPYQETLPQPKKSARDTYKPPALPEVVDLTENAVDVFYASKQKTSLEAKTYDGTIKTSSPETKHQGMASDENKFSFPTQSKIEQFFSGVEHKKGHSTSSPKNIQSFPKIVPAFESNKFVDPNGLNMSCNIEILRKSLDCLEQSPVLQDNLVQASTVEKVNSSIVDISGNSEEESNDDQDRGAHSDVPSLLLKEQLESGGSRTIKQDPKFQEDLKENLPLLMYDELKDLCLEPEVSDRYVKGSRRSCARKSTFISDSESSHRSSSESNFNETVNFVEDSEDAASEPCDSLNSASLSFVPDSSPNTPETVKLPKATHFVSETPPRAFGFDTESLPGNTSLNSSVRKLEGSVRRIKPLKVDKNQTPQNSSFVQAMAAAVILTPCNSPEKNISSVTTENFIHSPENKLNSDEDDSPIKLFKRKKPLQICSESEESDNEDQILSPSDGSKKSNIKLEHSYSDCLDDKDLENDECSHSEKSGVSDDDESDAELSKLSGSDIHEYDRNSQHSSTLGEENSLNDKDLENDKCSDSEKSDDDESDAELSNLSGSDIHEYDRKSQHSSILGEENSQRDSEDSSASEHENFDESGSVFSQDGKDYSDFETDED